jgi:hypothetical protein
MLIYSRNTDPLATDDYGQVAETSPHDAHCIR